MGGGSMELIFKMVFFGSVAILISGAFLFIAIKSTLDRHKAIVTAKQMIDDLVAAPPDSIKLNSINDYAKANNIIDEMFEYKMKIQNMKLDEILSGYDSLRRNEFKQLSDRLGLEISKTQSERIESFEQERMNPNIKAETSVLVQEYKRVCNNCGKVWFSLKYREDWLANRATCWTCQSIFGYLNGGTVEGHLASRNSADSFDNLIGIRKCPECGSVNFKEELLSFTR